MDTNLLTLGESSKVSSDDAEVETPVVAVHCEKKSMEEPFVFSTAFSTFSMLSMVPKTFG
jgi:hypothetical protein